jgi:hypothetical protein
MLFGKIFALTLATLVTVKAQFMDLPELMLDSITAFEGTRPIALNMTMEGATYDDTVIMDPKDKYRVVFAVDPKRNLTAT